MSCKIKIGNETKFCNRCIHPSVRWNSVYRKQSYCCRHHVFLVYYKGQYTNIKELIDERNNILLRDY